MQRVLFREDREIFPTMRTTFVSSPGNNTHTRILLAELAGAPLIPCAESSNRPKRAQPVSLT